MALRLLRGTTAQRTGFTPAEGEPVWDIDEQKLYVGDGATLGGIAIDVANASLSLDSLNDVDLTTPATTGQALVYDGNTFIAADATILSNKSVGDLSNVDITSVAPTTGQVLKWNGSAFVPGDDNSVAGTGLVEGATYNINISGNTYGSVYTADEVTLLVDGVTGKVTGNLHASVYSTDGNTLLVDAANSKITANVHASVYSTDGNTLLVDAAFARFGPGDFYGSLYSDDGNTLLVDGENGRISGDLYGNLIAADNVTLLVDRATSTINTNQINSSGDVPIVLQNDHRTPVQIKTVAGGPDGFPYTEYLSVRGTVDNPQSLAAGDIVGGWKVTGYDSVSGDGKVSALWISAFEADAVVTDNYPKSSASLLISKGGNTYNQFTFGSEGEFKAPGAITPGVFADAAARDAGITTPTAGMMVFVTDVTKFQGYDGSSWINLN